MKVFKLPLEKKPHNPAESNMHFKEFYAQEAKSSIKIKWKDENSRRKVL